MCALVSCHWHYRLDAGRRDAADALAPRHPSALPAPVLRRAVVMSTSSCGLDLGQGVGVVVSGPSDPVLAEISHAVLPELHRVVIFAKLTNVTRATISGITYATAGVVHLPARVWL